MTASAAVRLVSIAFGGPHPCEDGRICIPAAGISLVLAPGWELMTPKHGDDMLVAGVGGSESGPGVILSDGRRLLDSEPADLDALQTATLKAMGDDLFAADVEAAEQVELSIGPAVRLSYTRGFFGPRYVTIDHWFYAAGRLLVFRYMAPGGWVLTGDPPGLSAMAQSIRLIQ